MLSPKKQGVLARRLTTVASVVCKGKQSGLDLTLRVALWAPPARPLLSDCRESVEASPQWADVGKPMSGDGGTGSQSTSVFTELARKQSSCAR